MLFTYFKIQTNTKISHRKLIYLLEKIGNYYKSEFPSKESTVKKGIRKVVLEMRSADKKVTKTQIKLLLRNQRKTSLRIPNSSLDVFKKIVDIVYNNKQLLEICRKDLFHAHHMDGCLCRDNLVPDLYKILDSNSDYLHGRSLEIYIGLKDFHINCNPPKK